MRSLTQLREGHGRTGKRDSRTSAQVSFSCCLAASRCEGVVQCRAGASAPASSLPAYNLDNLGSCRMNEVSATATREGARRPGEHPTCAPMREQPRLTQRHDLPPSLRPQFCRNDTANPVPNHLLLVVDEDGSVVVEADVSAIWSAGRVLCSYDHCSSDVSLADLVRCRLARLQTHSSRLLDDHDNLVACGQ